MTPDPLRSAAEALLVGDGGSNEACTLVPVRALAALRSALASPSPMEAEVARREGWRAGMEEADEIAVTTAGGHEAIRERIAAREKE